MSDDPRIEAAAHVLREQLRSVTGTEILFPETAALVVMETLAAADRAALRPISEALEDPDVQNGKPISACELYRWHRYKPGAPAWAQKLGGRWQRYNGYGWENAEPPERYLPAPPEDSDDD